MDGIDAYPFVFPVGPMLPQVQVLDLLGSMPHLQPPLAQLLFHMKGLQFDKQLVHLGR
jgi:hypothetical protein